MDWLIIAASSQSAPVPAEGGIILPGWVVVSAIVSLALGYAATVKFFLNREENIATKRSEKHEKEKSELRAENKELAKELKLRHDDIMKLSRETTTALHIVDTLSKQAMLGIIRHAGLSVPPGNILTPPDDGQGD